MPHGYGAQLERVLWKESSPASIARLGLATSIGQAFSAIAEVGSPLPFSSTKAGWTSALCEISSHVRSGIAPLQRSNWATKTVKRTYWSSPKPCVPFQNSLLQ
ncbi:unnamed protein product [Cuscuta campestris]|uniref:Uncharacterized protein n=1 Tax=Cuscuta campestris TaxID=132261 RepID=A0A484MVM5_9ASTE|nr:unnamed protein product [Cuscuta campestris]VFQ93017.1 unnamed protein product [Cuscuta campestris]